MADRPLFDPSKIRPSAEPGPDSSRRVLSVTQANEMIRGAIATYVPATILVAGEIGDFSRASSGHLYFTLKDAASELRTVMWKTAAAKLKFAPHTGLEVICTGAIEVYAPRGSVQLLASRMEPRGIGALELALRQLREKLQREGLFEAARKRPLPRIAFRVGVVTSLQGAVLRDIVRTLARRNPAIDLLVFPVRVQGEGSAAEISRAIRLMSDHADALSLDVLIVARGGGSLEDLWPFQEEVVARAIVASRVPIISAVGHETDVSISDLVADVRAATPTAAAELVSPMATDLIHTIHLCLRRAARSLSGRVALAGQRVARCEQSPAIGRPMSQWTTRAQRVDELERRSVHLLAVLHRRWRDRLSRAELSLARSGAPRQLRIASRMAEAYLRRAVDAVRRRVIEGARRTSDTEHRLLWRSPQMLMIQQRERTRALSRRAESAIRRRLERLMAVLAAPEAELAALNPRTVLARGYSITRYAATGKVIRAAGEVRPGEIISTETADGAFKSRVEDIRQGRLFE